MKHFIFQNSRKLSVIFGLLLSPFIAFANAGSPMVWFGVFHLLVVNGIIGIIESRLLLKYKLVNKTGLIILGNYISMFVGLYCVAPYFTNNIYHINFWSGESFIYHSSYVSDWIITFLIGFFLSFITTLVIEYPFFYFSLKNKADRKQLFYPFFKANGVTNLAMACIYFVFIFLSS